MDGETGRRLRPNPQGQGTRPRSPSTPEAQTYHEPRLIKKLPYDERARGKRHRVHFSLLPLVSANRHTLSVDLAPKLLEGIISLWTYTPSARGLLLFLVIFQRPTPDVGPSSPGGAEAHHDGLAGSWELAWTP